MTSSKLFVSIVLLVVGVVGNQSNAQRKIAAGPPQVDINQQAIQARSGNVVATSSLTHQLFANVGLSTDLVDAFGLSDRVVQAEVAYRNNAHRGTNELDVVKAVNNLALTIGAPLWTRTDVTEVRTLRMHMVSLYPQLMAYQGAPDAQGNYKALSETMRPTEATALALTLVYQKMYNADYQLTSDERSQPRSLSAAFVRQQHLDRTQALQHMLAGRSASVSIRDLLSASDHFFSDMGIEPSVAVGKSSTLHLFSAGGR